MSSFRLSESKLNSSKELCAEVFVPLFCPRMLGIQIDSFLCNSKCHSFDKNIRRIVVSKDKMQIIWLRARLGNNQHKCEPLLPCQALLKSFETPKYLLWV